MSQPLISAESVSVALSWGAGRTGQLGNGTMADSLAPTAVTGLTRVSTMKISAGGSASADSFALALLSDGTIRAWGNNAWGQLGNGGAANEVVPAAVSRLTGIRDIAAGGQHALALHDDGQVSSWGDNACGQLGNYRHGDFCLAPGRVQDLPKVKRIAAGADFSLALLENGKVFAWGRGVHGQLGSGIRANSAVPQAVRGLRGVVSIAAGASHALALTGDGKVKSWGYNLYGQLGNSTTTSSVLPVDVVGLTDVALLSAGACHNYALTSSSSVWGWGNNQYAQLVDDDESVRLNRPAPVELRHLGGALLMAAGSRHGVAVFTDHVATWGHNCEGQLGNRTTAAHTIPTAVLGQGFRFAAASLVGNTTYAY